MQSGKHTCASSSIRRTLPTTQFVGTSNQTLGDSTPRILRNACHIAENVGPLLAGWISMLLGTETRGLLCRAWGQKHQLAASQSCCFVLVVHTSTDVGCLVERTVLAFWRCGVGTCCGCRAAQRDAQAVCEVVSDWLAYSYFCARNTERCCVARYA